MHVDNVRGERERVARTIAKWQSPAQQRGFELWLEYMEVMEQQRRQEVLQLTHGEIYDEHGARKVYQPGLLVSLKFDLNIDETLKSPEAAHNFSQHVISEVAQSVDISQRQLSVLCYERHEDDAKLVNLVVHDWYQGDGRGSKCKPVHDIAQEIQKQAQDCQSEMRRGEMGKKLEEARVCGQICKSVHDSVEKSYTGKEVFLRLSELEQEMANTEQDLHKALIKKVQHKRRTIHRMSHIEKAVAFDTFVDRLWHQAKPSPAQGTNNKALETAQRKLQREMERRQQTCMAVVHRMLQRQLLMAWNEFVDSVCTVQANRETVRKVLSRMTHRQLAGAFDCFAGHVDTVREQRERVARTLLTWKNPGLNRCMQGWVEYMDLAYEERMEEGREMMRKQMGEMGERMELEEARSKELVQQEADRRIDMCKRVVRRMLLHQLSMAWNEFVDSVCTVQANRETVRKVLSRMTHRQLAGAFDCFAGHVDTVREQRERVQQTMARWRTPGVRKALDRWLDYVDVMQSEREEEAQQMAREELLRQREELEVASKRDMSMGEARLQDEVKRRVETCKRVVKRMLHQQLVLAWETFVDCVMMVRAKRETVRRVLARMTHRQVMLPP